MRFPAPDFVVEILSKGTVANDRGVKFEDYAAHEVQEYWIIDPELEVVEQYILDDDVYTLLLKSDNGEIESRAIHGFKVPIRAVFDRQVNTDTLQIIISKKLDQ